MEFRLPKLIFDFDETLFTLQLPWHEWHQELPAKLKQLAPGLDLTGNMNDMENRAVIESGDAAWQFTREYSRQFERERLTGIIEQQDLTKLLPDLAAVRQLFLWTSNSRSTVEPILAKHDLLKLFAHLVTKEDVRLLKPAAEGFELIRAVGGGELADYTMVGDSENDRLASQAAGIAFIPRAEAPAVLRTWLS